jgi:hypothetical protein
VKYGDELGGSPDIRVSRSEVVKLSKGKMRGIGVGKKTISSRNYSLLVGEMH